MACFWLLLLGVVAKIGAAVAAIPTCIFGGVVAVLVAGQMVSGIQMMMVACMVSHRSRTVLAIGLASGLGLAMVPTWATAQVLFTLS